MVTQLVTDFTEAGVTWYYQCRVGMKITSDRNHHSPNNTKCLVTSVVQGQCRRILLGEHIPLFRVLQYNDGYMMVNDRISYILETYSSICYITIYQDSGANMTRSHQKQSVSQDLVVVAEISCCRVTTPERKLLC